MWIPRVDLADQERRRSSVRLQTRGAQQRIGAKGEIENLRDQPPPSFV
jgi:hypothetical protein